MTTRSGVRDPSSWRTPSGVEIRRVTERVGPDEATEAGLLTALDARRGLVLTRDGRRIGYTDPPLEVTATGDRMTLRALNPRGSLLLPVLRTSVAPHLHIDSVDDRELTGTVHAPDPLFSEEDRTRQVGIFRVVRAIIGALAGPDPLLGLYGAFGYDLIFALEPTELSIARNPDDRTLVLHLPDEIVEFTGDTATRHRYEFVVAGRSSRHLAGGNPGQPFSPGTPAARRELPPGGYSAIVERAMSHFHSGELFEVVPSQAFRRACTRPPSQLFADLRRANPAPHSLLANLGESEYLVGASPETFVDVDREAEHDHWVVRTSPISGTIARGRDALHDARQIRTLLNSGKDECELTMCTDVDRNDKARVCVPGTVRVTARREIVRYSRLIHTVDHVSGVLRPDRDGLDAFLAHLWAVTVTGAPKSAAADYIERHELSPRRWYGGAVGHLGFDGSVHTVLTLRTMHVADGVATVRAGATVLVDSDPLAEERETELKADALLRVLDRRPASPARGRRAFGRPTGAAVPGRRQPRVLLVDHRDSFVHTLADYLRQTGAEVTTYRAGRHLDRLTAEPPDLLVLSPGPGRPGDFDLAGTIAAAERLDIPVFGVCLGLQGLAEYAGADLRRLEHPMHGKSSTVRVVEPGSPLLRGIPTRFEVGRYHSLAVRADDLPYDLRPVAVTDDGLAMAVEHRSRPFTAVQFHPESIMTSDDEVGRRIIANVIANVTTSVKAGTARRPERVSP